MCSACKLAGASPEIWCGSKLKSKIKALTDGRCQKGLDTTKSELNTLLRGWFSYFPLGIGMNLFTAVDGWTRRRIRQLFWNHARRIEAGSKSLRN
ncbi:MAG: group II intron maturase-specific domain-containing protein [Succinivibrio sp.]